MQADDIRNPSERNKIILAGALGIVAILFLWWAFFGFGSDSKKAGSSSGPQPTPARNTRVGTSNLPPLIDPQVTDLNNLRPVVYLPPQSAPEAGRNIFAYYEPKPQVVKVPETPTPTPTPQPPVLLASVSPANVYAKTAEFTLEVTGDKFTPQLRVVIDNNELSTRYIGPQQLSATVPAALIANPGSHQVMLKSADGQLYSNLATLGVAEAPKPNYSYIGIIGTRRYIDTAILQDKNNKETLNVQRGDILGRFRVTSISEKEIVLVDKNLNIKHALPLTIQGDRGNPQQRPTAKVESEDDEP